MNLEKKVAIVTGVSPDSIGEAYARVSCLVRERKSSAPT